MYPIQSPLPPVGEGQGEGEGSQPMPARILPAMNPKPSSAVPSPCVSVCRMHGLTGWCEGCLRTIDEIAMWSQMSDGEKRDVWKQLPLRRLNPLQAGA